MRMNSRRSMFAMVLVIVTVLSVSLSTWAAEIVILHTNDVHGRLVSHMPQNAENEIGGMVRLATLVEEIREEYGDKVLLLDAGDAIHGTNVVNLFGGLSAIEVMNTVGYDAFTLGNHDFNYGQDVLLERMADAKFPFLAANVTTESGSLLGYSALIQEVDGLRVGIIGVIDEETPVLTHPKNVEGLVFHDPIEIASSLAKRLRGEVDLLIALTHIGYANDVELAKAAPEFDVIVGGHSHTILEDAVDVGGVLIVQSHEYANNLGFLRLVVEDKKIVKYERNLIPVTHTIPKNAKVQAVVDEWDALLQERLNQVVGTTEVSWDGERANVRTGETNLGNLIADVMRDAVGADIAFMNGGGIRASIGSGDVTVGDIYTVLPFDNTLALIQLRGMDILDALEHSVRLLPEQNGGFMQVSGLSFEVDPNGFEGGRVLNVKVNGETLGMNKLYTVATNDFLAAGGDGYDVLKNGTLLADTGIMLRDVVVDYFLENDQVREPEAGRIVIVN